MLPNSSRSRRSASSTTLLVALVELGRSARRRARAAPAAPPRPRSRRAAARRPRARRRDASRGGRARTRRAPRSPRSRRRRGAGEPQARARRSRAPRARPQVPALEDDRDARARGSAASSASSSRASDRPKARTSPAEGSSRPAARCEHRALARADGPRTATSSPRLDPQVEAAQRHRLGRARAEDLEDVVELERAAGDLVPALARARGRGSLPPPEALDHQPVGVDVVDALRRAEIDDRAACPPCAEVVAVDDQRDALAGHRVRRALGRVDDLDRRRAPIVIAGVRRAERRGRRLRAASSLDRRRRSRRRPAGRRRGRCCSCRGRPPRCRRPLLRPALRVLDRVAGRPSRKVRKTWLSGMSPVAADFASAWRAFGDWPLVVVAPLVVAGGAVVAGGETACFVPPHAATMRQNITRGSPLRAPPRAGELFLRANRGD